MTLTARQRRNLSGALLVAALVAYPFVDRALQAQTVHAVTDAMIYVLLALGLNIVVGYAGLLDLGYAAFFAIGAYAMGLLNSPVLGSPFYGWPWSFWVLIWVSAVVSAVFGVMIGAPTLRVRGDYLAIITLAFGEIIPVAIRNMGDITIDVGGWRPIERLNLTGGENGVNPVGRPYLPGVDFETEFIPWYFLILVIGAASLWAMNRMRDSRLGRAWMAIREDETAADCTGVNPVKTKLLAFSLGASFSGFAGSFYAAKLQAITPGAFEFNVSIMLLCMVVLGGIGSLKGVILGGMVITLFDRILLAQMLHGAHQGGSQKVGKVARSRQQSIVSVGRHPEDRGAQRTHQLFSQPQRFRRGARARRQHKLAPEEQPGLRLLKARPLFATQWMASDRGHVSGKGLHRRDNLAFCRSNVHQESDSRRVWAEGLKQSQALPHRRRQYEHIGAEERRLQVSDLDAGLPGEFEGLRIRIHPCECPTARLQTECQRSTNETEAHDGYAGVFEVHSTSSSSRPTA